MRNGRAGWFVALAFWCGFALLVAAGRDAAVWVRAVVWTGVALLFVAIAGETSEAGPPRRPSPE